MHPITQMHRRIDYSVNQQPQPQSLLPQPQLPKPPQRRRIIIRITIQEEPPQPQPLLQPQPIAVPPFPFLSHTMKRERNCYSIGKLNYSAVYTEDLSCNISVFGKEQNRLRRFKRSAESAQRHL